MDTQPTLSPARRSGIGKVAVSWIAAIAFVAGAVAAMIMYGNIGKRKWEAEHSVLRIVELSEITIDPAEWGKNFSRQYDGYIHTADNTRACFKWSEDRPPEEGEAAEASIDSHDAKAASKLVGESSMSPDSGPRRLTTEANRVQRRASALAPTGARLYPRVERSPADRNPWKVGPSLDPAPEGQKKLT
jgi:hypothetical protein